MNEPADPAPDLCPLCGKPNQCAMEAARATGEEPPTCWCRDVDFSPERLERGPAANRRRACICRDCAEAG